MYQTPAFPSVRLLSLPNPNDQSSRPSLRNRTGNPSTPSATFWNVIRLLFCDRVMKVEPHPASHDLAGRTMAGAPGFFFVRHAGDAFARSVRRGQLFRIRSVDIPVTAGARICCTHPLSRSACRSFDDSAMWGNHAPTGYVNGRATLCRPDRFGRGQG